MSEVVTVSEGLRPIIGIPRMSGANAGLYLVCRLFTDAVFSQDIRSIQLIVNRIDGGLPSDVDMPRYRTRFSECLNAVLSMEDREAVKVKPDDTVMMALAKSLYSMSVQDIYWDEHKGRLRKPREEAKKERDAALRMVLERTGGRKTTVEKVQEVEEPEVAGWIEELPKNTC